MAKYINADALREIWVWGTNDKYGYSECIPLKDLDDFPAANVRENVRGEWKVAGDYLLCSECGKYFGVAIVGTHGEVYMTPFCPNCGADMRGEK